MLGLDGFLFIGPLCFHIAINAGDYVNEFLGFR